MEIVTKRSASAGLLFYLCLKFQFVYTLKMVRERVARVIDGKILESIVPDEILRKTQADGLYSKPTIFIQTTPASTWIVNHNLGRLPLVNVFIDDAQVDTDIIVTDYQITVVFPNPLSGKISYT